MVTVTGWVRTSTAVGVEFHHLKLMELLSQCLKHVEDIRRHAPSTLTLAWGWKKKNINLVGVYGSQEDSFLRLWGVPRRSKFQYIWAIYPDLTRYHFNRALLGSSSRVKVSIVDPPREILLRQQKSIPKIKINEKCTTKSYPYLPFFFFVCESQKWMPATIRWCNFFEVFLGPRLILFAGENPRKQKEVGFLRRKTGKPWLSRHSSP